MTERLSPAERALLRSARRACPSPIPTQVISNGEFLPAPQGELQKKFAARLKQRADILAKKHGQPRRAFLRTASGMAAAFLAMNDVYGPIFRVGEAEAADAELGDEHAGQLSGQYGYTIGDNTHKEISRYPWYMDDEKVAYRGYEKFDKAGIRIVAVHKGLFPSEQ